MLEPLAIYLPLGAAAGITAGLFGVGGGLLIVPVLVITFAFQGVSSTIATHCAIATSLACIIVTSISSTLAHQRHSAVRWDIFKPLSLGIIIGAYLGVKVAVALPGTYLQIALGIFVLLMGVQMLWNLTPPPTNRRTPNSLHGIAGAAIGTLSSLFGIGGGVLTVSYLSWRHTLMQQAVATSAACGIPIAIVGALSNVMEGWQHPDMPDYSLGFIYLPALAGIVITSAPCARLGAKIAHKLSPKTLKKIFAFFLFAVGLYFLARNLYPL